MMDEASRTVERLHEALIDQERSRRRELELRRIESSLFDVVRVLALADHPYQTFHILLETLRGALGFEDAAIFIPGGQESFGPVAVTCEWLGRVRFTPQQMLKRVMAGHTVVAFDTGQVPEWRRQDPEIRARLRSALHAPLRSGDECVILVCTHSMGSRFERQHVEIVQRLLPLMGQILHKLELHDALAAQERERQDRLAIFHAVVEHMPAGVMVEDTQRKILAANEMLCRLFALETPAEELIGTSSIALGQRISQATPNPEAFMEGARSAVLSHQMQAREVIRLRDGRRLERDYIPVSIPGVHATAHFWQYREV